MHVIIRSHGDPPGTQKREYVLKHVYDRIKTFEEWKLVHLAFLQKKVAAWPGDFSRGPAMIDATLKTIAKLTAHDCLVSMVQAPSKTTAGIKQTMRRDYLGVFMPRETVVPFLERMVKYPEWAMRATDYRDERGGIVTYSTFDEDDVYGAYFPVAQSRGIREEEWWENEFIKMDEPPEVIKHFYRFGKIMEMVRRSMMYVELIRLKWPTAQKNYTTSVDVLFDCVVKK